MHALETVYKARPSSQYRTDGSWYFDNYGQSLVSCAAENGHQEIVMKLLEWDSLWKDVPDHYGLTPLYYAPVNGHEDIVRALLGFFADGKKVDRQIPSCLTVAVQKSNVEVVRVLLSLKKFTAQALNDPKLGLLHLAIEARNREIVKLLLDCDGVDVNLKRACGETPIWCAIEQGTMIIELLKTKKIDLHAAKFGGKTPLEFAIQRKQIRAIRVLRDYYPK
ncbi:ankyrin repeat-containing domain protein [Podospora fimiseda]|uniref:Ankyrin repeat-containing domain protein n=1 Tax=Podospora fimiseda TaxID=252190 RepID=A0AAN6YTN1_9PEZI|nr:ankyrin repeat-containing domain protein [Podospora fimiseda]